MDTTATVRSDFATRLYDKLAAIQAGKNLFLSPFSIRVALAMCAVGARGETRRVLADHLRAYVDARSDNLSIKFPATSALDSVVERISAILVEDVRPVPNPTAIENMKFTECLSPDLAAEVFCARFNDAEAVKKILGEPRRVVVEQ